MSKKEDKKKVEDYGIGETKLNNKIETKLSPRLYLYEHGIHILDACPCQNGDDLGTYEIRFDPAVLENMDSLDGFVINPVSKAEKMRAVYESIVAQAEYDFWAFVQAKIPARFSEKIEIDGGIECENLKGIKDVTNKNDYLSFIEKGHVLRLFYSSIEDCFADVKKIFREIYESYFRDSVVDYEFKSVNKVVIMETIGRWVLEDKASDKEAPKE